MFNHFYHGTTRQYINIFGSLFDNIIVKRADGKTIRVPLGFANKEKYIAKFNSDLFKDKTGLPENDNDKNGPLMVEVETILPRMGYSMNSLQYDPQRKTNLKNKTTFKRNSDGTRSMVMNPVPYNLSFELDVYTRYEDDILQIVEQILPFFQPHFNITIKDLVSGTDVVVNSRDISIDLESVQPEEDLEGESTQRRVLQWSFTFLLKGFYYPMIKDNVKEIKTVINNLYDVDTEVGDVTDLDQYAVNDIVQWDVNPPSANENEEHDEDSTWGLT
ncbi:tail sheath stabilizer and completion protein [Paraglaciecola Antarctic GD virus 1]|nr:tail sheath stabilizer and completion protein [Paraglaciecola Antarctic GD virus 1]